MSDASVMLRNLSEPRPSGEFVKNAIDRASRLAGLGYWRAFDIWYCKARKVEEYEIDAIKEALRTKNERAARNELQQAKLLLAQVEARLNSTGDADFHQPYIDGLRAQTSGMGESRSRHKR
ncbi:hypothetical protein [Bradyrhizobium sp.]|uniref:hypothetical protein n=1 Tax=Bradyrhizobium sp. TaxID=376 RepID=UPI0025C66EF9|nr:hypothetical protein [Bradyrhizobium sp.]